jgi:4-hydroxybenzoyl-CoA thioesterase
MNQTHLSTVTVHFGDCDPAGIVFFANFNKWMDDASHQYFWKCGLPRWADYQRATGILGTPMVETHTRFASPATYGDVLTVATTVLEWRNKVFIQTHNVMRGDTLICEGRETRVFVRPDPHDPTKIRAVPIPADVIAACALKT